jgi:RNA polymerase sigma-70 factor (ECF subfamily)
VRRLAPARQVPDAELVERARGGDAWAREMVYRRYAAMVIGVATRLLGNRAEAEDVAQDAFISAFEDMAKLRDPDALGSWLTGITVHRVHKRFRRRALRRRLGLDRGATDLTALIARPVTPEARASMVDLARALDRLPAVQRTCWWLRYGEGCALQEVADAHDCSLATAKRRIAAAHAVVTRTLTIEDRP